MSPSGMLRCVALVRTDVSEALSASIIRMTRTDELGMSAITSSRHTLRRNTKGVCVSVASYGCCSYFTDSCHPDDEGARFLRNVGSYKSNMA
jgi:hypothetical protein